MLTITLLWNAEADLDLMFLCDDSSVIDLNYGSDSGQSNSVDSNSG